MIELPPDVVDAIADALLEGLRRERPGHVITPVKPDPDEPEADDVPRPL